MTAKNTLTPKQAAFVDHYARNGGNGAQAYRDAGYAVNGPTVARTEAVRLLSNPNVTSAITRQLATIQDRATVDHDRLVGYALAVYHGAIADREWGNANQAVVTLGRLTGLLQDKRTVRVEHDRETVRAELARLFTFDELLAMREQLALSEATTVAVDVTDIEDDV